MRNYKAMRDMSDEKYAVAVRDEGVLFLFMWIRRSQCGEFFVMLPRPHDPSIDAHASLHADGRYHVKSHGLPKIMCKQKQKPNHNLLGTEHLLDQGLTRTGPRSIGQVCSPSEFSDVFEIPVNDLVSGKIHRTNVTADLVDSRTGPHLFPEARVLQQVRFRTSVPYLVITHYVAALAE